MKASRWTPLARFPTTGLLYKHIPAALRKKKVHRPQIVGDGLCNDILQRLSPYLLRKPPVDILDLWPGAGLWSSKVNEFLRPRRHVLVEPDLKTYGKILKSLAASKPCYNLVSRDIHHLDDWHSLLAEYLPEQGPSNCDTTGALGKNDTLLVLANIPPNASKQDHFTPARSWSILMEACMRQSGLSSYGSVRMITSLPLMEAQTILPRSVSNRSRPALLTENVAMHAFEVASTADPSYFWTMSKGWDLTAANAARVAERSAEHKIVVPAGKALPPIPSAPESPDPGKIPCPHVPRIKTVMHDRILETIQTAEESPGDVKAKKKKQRALVQLRQDNRTAFARKELVEKQARIDELTRSLSRAAADPAVDSKSLQPMVDRIAALKAETAQQHSEIHFEVLHHTPSMIDDARSALSTGTFDDAVLLWDRRPFEPLLIDPEELYPRDTDTTMLYFEADAHSPIMQLLTEADQAGRADLHRIYEAISLTFSSRGTMTVTDLLKAIFPARPINDLVRAIPSLATYASKTPKPDFDTLPKTVSGRPGAAESTCQDPHPPLDPVTHFQENLDYDLSDVRIRCLSSATLWEIVVEYHKSNAEVNAVQLNRLLGGTLTSFRSGEYGVEQKKMR
ncbi:uncharacterized protein ACLA_036700 [Aspergillus clavatus NRRL 1]|uniref:Uncharacterized protein n=1 Tax=Aspergillus clavatus (strain ATCC 1007 / CBS 513.65 / DSM 816 / NCTC 3887 / NRRL 1 / QM 1276 / 107) TaxID=344612 RepID=A1CJZ1_ASPCL|nr:uncharacterized protein ACLA_036700 [Aspergillus clavatus NRRL 1]EAW09465.1 conserved hypothetical protein [Aspergillus clavatus NRRL 1]